MTTVLETRVKGVNRCHKYANELYPVLLEAFSEFVGNKVELAVGGLTQKVRNKIDQLNLPCTPGLHVSRYPSRYNICYRVTTSECSDKGHAYYHEVSLYIGELDGNVLKKINDLKDFKPYKIDYEAADIEIKRTQYKLAKSLADAAQAALYPFGEYDR